ncbi:MAG: hypothetical protein M3P98_02885 [bacterium]|nr:hypothetical protein [bacterium]
MSMQKAKLFGELDVIGSFELPEDQRQHLHEFRDALNSTERFDVMDPGRVYVDPTEALHTPLNEIIARKIIERTVRKAPIAWVSPIHKKITLAGLDSVDPLRSARAETAAHNGFFAVMYNSKDLEKYESVYIKPFEERREKAVHDWLNGLMAKEWGQQTFSPLGFLMGEQSGYSITLLQDDADTLENTNWRTVFIDPTNPDNTEQIETIESVGRKLAEIHNDGIFHKDTQFKNIAWNVLGEVYLIDWESAQIFGNDGEQDRKISLAAHDLIVLFGSMFRTKAQYGVGLLSDFTEETQWYFFDKHVLTPYLTERIGTTDDPNIIEVCGEIEEIIKTYILDGCIQASLQRVRNR